STHRAVSFFIIVIRQYPPFTEEVDHRAVAFPNGDASMMLMLLLMAHKVSPRALATLVGDLAPATGCCWAITTSAWAPVLIVDSSVATTAVGGALWCTCSTVRWTVSTASDDSSPSNRILSTGVAPIVQSAIYSSPRRATLGPNICSAAGAESITSGATSVDRALRPSTLLWQQGASPLLTSKGN
uniref:Uncharacterized protein n=1 Tax=Romanomermis culicivorax TaxID=13658 RepID=A0A915LCC2_ROMCU